MENEINSITPSVLPSFQTQPTTEPLESSQKEISHKKIKNIIGVVVILFLIILIISLIIVQKKVRNNISSDKPPFLSQLTPTTILTSTPDTECAEFIDKLENCLSYSCEFTHPLTKEKLIKEINGLVNGKCNYVEAMPNNGKMECDYELNQLKVIASYYRDMNNAESFEAEISSDFDETKISSSYTINGKEVPNPLQELINNGQCTVIGY